MILQALNAYYWRKQADPEPRNRLPAYGLEEKEIPFIIEIDTDGRLVNLTDTRSVEGKRKVGQRFLVPQGVKKTSGVAANLLWDTSEYVLGIPDAKKLEAKRKRGPEEEQLYLQRLQEMKASFRKRIADLPEHLLTDTGVQAVLHFMDRSENVLAMLDPVWKDVSTTNPTMTFRLVGDVEIVCQRRADLVLAVAATEDDTTALPCLVTGEYCAIERIHAAIAGVWDKPGATVQKNIVSFNARAFESYGKRMRQGDNAPVGKPAAFAYTTALNHLLERNSRQRVQVGDTSTVFWAEQPHDLETLVPDLFGEPPKDDPARGTAALKALYAAVASGKFTVGAANDRFHVLGLAPNAARISIRFWETAPAAALAARIHRHFEGLRVAHGPRDPEHLSIFRLLTSCAVQGKADNIPPNLGGEVMRTILEDLPYPTTLLSAAVQRCRAERQVTYPRAALIKAWLNRVDQFQTQPHSEKEFLPMLDLTNPNPAYRLGRLFATLEKIQEEASPGLNATIRDRYYGAASGIPVSVFPTLLRLKNHHLGKLNTGRAVQMERLIGEILGGLTDFPGNLALPEQGRFALGYYHQRQAFFTKTESTSDANSEKE